MWKYSVKCMTHMFIYICIYNKRYLEHMRDMNMCVCFTLNKCM